MFGLDFCLSTDDSGTVIRTLAAAGTNSILYQSTDIASDGLGTSLDLNIYKISSITGPGFPGLVREATSAGTSTTVITNPGSSSTKGFKIISANYTIEQSDDCFWLLVDTSDGNIDVTLPNAIANINLRVQNTAEGTVNLFPEGSLTAVQDSLAENKVIYLAHRSAGIWHGAIGGSRDVPWNVRTSSIKTEIAEQITLYAVANHRYLLFSFRTSKCNM